MKFLWRMVKSTVKKNVSLALQLKQDDTGTFAKVKVVVFGETIFKRRAYLPLDEHGNFQFGRLIEI